MFKKELFFIIEDKQENLLLIRKSEIVSIIIGKNDTSIKLKTGQNINLGYQIDYQIILKNLEK